MCIGMSLMQQDSERVCYFRVHLDDFSKKQKHFEGKPQKKIIQWGMVKAGPLRKTFF